MPDEQDYRVVSGTVHKWESADPEQVGSLVSYGPGDAVSLRPCVAERFNVEPVDEDGGTEAESDSQSEAGDGTAEDPDGAEVTVDGTQSDENEATGPAPDPITDEWVDSADYDDLRSVAPRFEDVNGNWGEDRLRAELAEKTE